MSASTLIGFREQQHDRGIATSPELDQAIRRIGEVESHDKWYAKLSNIQKLLHRRKVFKDSRNWCMEDHK